MPPTGHPEFFFSHGVQNPVLPIDQASRRIVPQLQQEGYTVTLVEFQGGHLVPPSIALAPVHWFLR